MLIKGLVIGIISLACGFCWIALAQGGSQKSAESLAGLWGVEQTLAPMVGGELTIDGRSPTWRATIAGFTTTVEHSGDRITFILQGGQGEFRGRMTAGSKLIRGHWIQLASIDRYNQRYASPVTLETVSENIWRGQVVPLQYYMSLYVSIEKGNDGAVNAFIKNPEANFFQGRSYSVELKGDSLELKNPNVPEAGTYDPETDRLVIPLLHSYPPLGLTRRKDHSAVGFYPRVYDPAGYVYRKPIAENDG